jgi:DNA polymerase III epsilon subunit-like protein
MDAQTGEVVVPPKEIVPFIIDQFEYATEQAIGEYERDLLKASQAELERSLLYALRVSKCVPEVKTMKTLASRWSTACSGAGGYGLFLAKNSANYNRVFQLLKEMYLQRFAELSHEIVSKASTSAQKRKSVKAKQNAFIRAGERIEKATDEFASRDLLELDDQAGFTINILNRHVDFIGTSESSKPLDLLRLLAIRKAKHFLALEPVFLDTETTGLGQLSEIIEIAVVDSEGNALVDTLVKPRDKIPPEATEIHGISNQDVAKFPTFPSVWQNELQPILADKTVCVFNSAFDLRLIGQTLLKYALPPHEIEQPFCIMKLYADFNGRWDSGRKQNRWRKMSIAADQCGISKSDTLHRALADVQLARNIFLHIANQPIE